MAKDLFEGTDLLASGPRDLFADEPSLKKKMSVGASEGFAGMGNLADILGSLAVHTVSRIGKSGGDDSIFEKLNERVKSRSEWANPEKIDAGVPGAIAAGVTGLPGMLMAPVSGLAVSKDFLDRGEPLGRSLWAGGMDSALSTAGMAVPILGKTGLGKVASTAALNPVQGGLSDLFAGAAATKDETKAAYDWANPNRRISEFVTGAGFGGAAAAGSRTSKGKPSPVQEKLTALETAKKAPVEFTPEQLELPLQTSPQAIAEMQARGTQQMDLFASDTANRDVGGRLGETIPEPIVSAERTHDFLSRVKQDEIDATPHGERPAQYGMTDTGGRVDENGIPIRADLSMEAQNLQDPLQRNLWGDELPGKTGDGGVPLTKALDSMPAGEARDTAMSQLRGQRGAIDLDAFRRQREEQEFALGKRIPVGEVTEFGIEDVTPAPEMRSAPETIPMDQPKAGAPRDLSPFASDIGNVYNPTDGFRGMGRGQRGALNFGEGSAKQKLIEEATKNKLFAPLPKADDIITNALSSGKDSSGSINFSAGGSLEAAKRRSPLIEGGVRVVQGLKNMAEDAVRTTVFPAEKSLRALKKQDVIDLADVFKSEMFTRTKYSMDDLAGLGLSEKQLVAYQKVRDMHEAALTAENKARGIMGQKPITALEHYLSSRWQGDFRVAFHNAEGKHVWSLAADNKWSLDKQASKLLARYPDLTPGETYTVKSNKKGISASQVYTQMLDVLGRDAPAIIKIKEWTEEQLVLEGRKTLGQEKHFEPKGNVRGFVGDRPWIDPFKNALDLFQQQISYSKNAHNWSALQEAGHELKKVFANDELALQQPGNMKYLREYFSDQLGFNENQAIKAIENQIRDMGISPNQIGRGVSSVKNLWVTQKLALNLGFALSNVIQAGNILPHLADIQVKYGGNPVSSLIIGPLTGTAMAAGHMAQLGPKFYKMLGSMPGYDAFFARAMKYAEDNSVVARSIYDESPIESSFSKTAMASKIAGKTITTPETLLRGISFMTYVEQLRSSGKFKNDLELFRVAEEKVNISMGDYREGERALIFSKLGNLGNALNVLQTFPMNFYNQWSWAAREAGKGNVLPGMTMFGIQAYMAGAMGIPGFAEMDKGIEWIKDWVASSHPTQWNKIKDFSLKRLVLDTMGEGALYGGASTQSGVAITSRAAAPIPTEMLQAPGAPWVDLAKQAGSVASLAADPLNPQKQAQAAMHVAPNGLIGYLETGPFRDETSVQKPDGTRIYGKPKNLAERTGMIARTLEEEHLRTLGFRSQKEAVTRELAYQADKQTQNATKVINALPGKIYNELRNNNQGKAKDLVKLYVELSGANFDGAVLEKEMVKEYTTPTQRSAMRQNMSVEAALAVKRLHETLKALGYAD